MDIERQRKHFNQIAERYRQARTHQNHLQLKSLIWSHFLNAHQELKKNPLVVLEAMCGYAEGHDILQKYLGCELDYEGFDYSDDVVQYMNEKRPELKIFHQDVTLFETSRQYDVIILLGGLHHVPDHCDLALERVYAALKPGGVMINLEPTHGTFITRWTRERIYAKNSLFDQQTERAFEVDAYFQLFEKHGFTLKDAIFPGMLAYILYYNPDAFPLLNKGNPKWVERLFKLEAPILRSKFARSVSFATLALWEKPL